MDASTHQPPGSVKESFNLDITTEDVALFHRAIMQKKRYEKNPLVQKSPYIPNKTTPKKNRLNKIHLRGQHRSISIA